MVDLALLAMALAIFAKSQHHEPAATEASKRYCGVLKVAQEKVARLSSSTLDEHDIDSCLLAVSLMSRYELAAHHPGVYDSSMQSCSHYNGALAILKVWFDRLRDKSPTFIIKLTRRELIKSAIIRNRKLPDWLLDGTQFGEHDEDLGYYRIVSRLCKLNYAFKSLQQHYPRLGEVDELDIEARKLDKMLQDWAAHVPVTCSPQRHSITQPKLGPLPRKHFYSSTVYIYPKNGNAAAWCQYYAVRMLVNSIRVGILGMSLEPPMEYKRQRLDRISEIRAMADSIVASIPFCLKRVEMDSSSLNSRPSVNISADEEIKPHSASLLVWPLTIASGIKELDAEQQIWLRSELAAFGEITGDGILDTSEADKMVVHRKSASPCKWAP